MRFPVRKVSDMVYRVFLAVRDEALASGHRKTSVLRQPAPVLAFHQMAVHSVTVDSTPIY
ncbi:hypothetical protein ACSLVK_08730 [Photorhabdus tasmaniensis]|uniref:hypothetical protein n=1 Tax=Photorhabdus TaxID=29487 RepID=UPI0036DF6711